jgi:hypothetical protein
MLIATRITARYEPVGADAAFGFDFALSNVGDALLPLAEITVRYWYTSDEIPTVQSLISAVGEAVGTSADVSVVHIEDEHGRQFIEFGFRSGTLSNDGDAEASRVQFRAVRPEAEPTAAWLDSQVDDYSFDVAANLSRDYDKLTVYRQGHLVWGVEPAAP